MWKEVDIIKQQRPYTEEEYNQILDCIPLDLTKEHLDYVAKKMKFLKIACLFCIPLIPIRAMIRYPLLYDVEVSDLWIVYAVILLVIIFATLFKIGQHNTQYTKEVEKYADLDRLCWSKPISQLMPFPHLALEQRQFEKLEDVTPEIFEEYRQKSYNNYLKQFHNN